MNNKYGNTQVFQPHQFGDAQYVDLYHVYDNASQAPYRPGVGIQCGAGEVYRIHPECSITPTAMRQHLNWNNRVPTQFISFYDDRDIAFQEMFRRRGQPLFGARDPNSVRVAHVRIPARSSVWVFSRAEMLEMMRASSEAEAWELQRFSGANEWFVWGMVPEAFVGAIHI